MMRETKVSFVCVLACLAFFDFCVLRRNLKNSKLFLCSLLSLLSLFKKNFLAPSFSRTRPTHFYFKGSLCGREREREREREPCSSSSSSSSFYSRRRRFDYRDKSNDTERERIKK